MHFPSNKLESLQYIKDHGLPHPEYVIVNNHFDVCKALIAYQYCVSFRSLLKHGGGPFALFVRSLTADPSGRDLIRVVDQESNISIFELPFQVYRYDPKMNKSCNFNAEIQLHADGTMDAKYSCEPEVDMRTAMKDATEKRASWDYKPLREAVELLCKHRLVGPVVELSRFGKDYVIWEVRMY